MSHMINVLNSFRANGDICSWADLEGGQGVRTPLKTHKNIGFHSNTGPNPLKNQKAIKPVFNVGPSSQFIVTPAQCYLNGVSLAGR